MRANRTSAKATTGKTGLRLIILYKSVKASLTFVLAATLGVLMSLGDAPELRSLVSSLRQHVVGGWSIALADLVIRAVEPHHLWMVIGALALDTTLTLLEGASLWRGGWWGPWLVVVATGALLPFEIVSFFRGVHLGRVLVFAVNIVIVVYLARHSFALQRTQAKEGS